jgi:hypothetical protein
MVLLFSCSGVSIRDMALGAIDLNMDSREQNCAAVRPMVVVSLRAGQAERHRLVAEKEGSRQKKQEPPDEG